MKTPKKSTKNVTSQDVKKTALFFISGVIKYGCSGLNRFFFFIETSRNVKQVTFEYREERKTQKMSRQKGDKDSQDDKIVSSGRESSPLCDVFFPADKKGNSRVSNESLNGTKFLFFTRFCLLMTPQFFSHFRNNTKNYTAQNALSGRFASSYFLSFRRFFHPSVYQG